MENKKIMSGTDTDLLFQEYSSIDEIWEKLHKIQTDFCFAQELSCYYRSQAWHNSKEVIDLGTGTGYYLQQLQSLFPKKKYTGIDLEKKFIDFASQRYSDKNISFERSDLFNVKGNFDFIIMRLVLQHLKAPKAALDKIVEFLKQGGEILIIDALDPYRYYYPAPTEYINFFTAYAKHQLKEGMDRDIAGKVSDMIINHPALQLKEIQEFIIPSTIGNNLSLFEQTYYLVIQLIEKQGNMAYDFQKVKQAWIEWCQLPDRYMQVGLRCITLNIRE